MSAAQLRPVTAGDGPALAALAAASRSTTAGLVRSKSLPRAEMVDLALQSGAVGVAAESPEHAGLVGAMWMTTGECWYEGAVRAYACLYGKIVHPACRRQGIGLKLSAWLLALADERLGPARVTFACISPRNEASLAGGRKWSTQQIAGRVETVLADLRSGPPRQIAGLDVRPARRSQLEEFVGRANDCHRRINLYSPMSAESLLDRLSRQALGCNLAEALVAVGGGGRMLAGLVLNDTGSLAPVQIESVPWPVRLAGIALGVLPKDGLVKRIRVTDFWFQPGGEAAAAHLWESARWHWRERGNLVSLTRDPRSPLAKIVRPARLRPSPRSVLFLAGPVPLDAASPLYLQHV